MANASSTHLTALQTGTGLRSIPDSVAYCNRCGMCASVCPSYQLFKQEPFSPRGRNQTLRLLLSGRIKLKPARKAEYKLAEEMVHSCILCGRCVQYCPGEIATPEHVVELRRRLAISVLPVSLFYLLRLRQSVPTLFALLVRTGLALRWTGLGYIAACLPGFTWLWHALKLLPRKTAYGTGPDCAKPTLIYLPSLEAQFFMPSLFEKTYRLGSRQHKVRVWENTSSGLFEYIYGDLRRARKRVRQLMKKHAEQGNGKLPILTDSIDVYYFLTRAEELFAGYKTLEKKAARFAACIRYVTDFLPEKMPAAEAFSSPVQFMSGAAFSQQTLPQLKAQQILHTLFDKNFVQCGYKEGTVPPVGCGFVKHTHAPAYSLSAVQSIAAHQTQCVFVLSGLAALELMFYTRKFYPVAQVRHIVELNG